MNNEVIIVTGANNGIGLGLIRALRDEGRLAVGLDLSLENLGDMPAYICDVTDPGQTRNVVEKIIERYGKVDVLVNNACLAVFAPFEEKDLADTRREFEVNYFGYINMIQAVLPYMKEQKSGVIHNTSSTVGWSGFAGIYGYASTKGAVEALSRTMAIELEPYGIIVNIIHPPLTRTRSAAPLGIPASFMSDAEDVGRRLAGKMGSKKPLITPGFMERLGVFGARLMPGLMGRFMSERAAIARQESNNSLEDNAGPEL